MERKHLASILFFPHVFPASTTSATVKMYSNVGANQREIVNILANLLFCSSIFNDYRTLFLKKLILLLFRTVFRRKYFMDVFVFSSAKSSGNCSSFGWFHLWKVFALEPSEISLSANMFCHQSHKQPHTMPTSHSERLFVSSLLIPVILLSFKSVALLAGSEDPKPVTRCHQAPTLKPPDQNSAFSQKFPISQVYAHSFSLHNPIETASYYSAKKEEKWKGGITVSKVQHRYSFISRLLPLNVPKEKLDKKNLSLCCMTLRTDISHFQQAVCLYIMLFLFCYYICLFNKTLFFSMEMTGS